MKASTWVTLGRLAMAVGGIGVGTGGYFGWPVVLVAGLIIVAVGTFGVYHFGKKAEEDKKRETFQKSLHFHRLEGYWVEISADTYQLGLVATILNKDATRALVFEGVGYQGGFTLGGSGSATYQSIKLYDGPVTVHGNYFLKPGGEAVIHISLPSEVKMTIHGGVPGLRLEGTWTFVFEDTQFPVMPPSVRMLDVLSLDDWRDRSAES